MAPNTYIIYTHTSAEGIISSTNIFLSKKRMEFTMPIIDQEQSRNHVVVDNNHHRAQPQRRSANYKPNMWNYQIFQNLHTDDYTGDKYGMFARTTKEEVIGLLKGTEDPLAKLELIDKIAELGLGNLFEEEIMEALNNVISTKEGVAAIKRNLYATALCFRLLRLYGFDVQPSDMFMDLIDEMGKPNRKWDVKALVELYEASNLAMEGEDILELAKQFSTENLKIMASSNLEGRLSEMSAAVLRLPLQRRVEWYDVKRNINEYEKEEHVANGSLIKLAKLNFNMIQATHQRDLAELSSWWVNLNISKELQFARDRMVESYLWATGVAFEPRFSNCRKWLAKVINFILVVDDLYDIYGSLHELDLFTHAVIRWDLKEAESLSECMRTCFKALYDTTNDIASEISKDKGLANVLPFLHKAWVDFCKSLLEEARWYHTDQSPSLEEYIRNGWVSGSGPLLSVHVLLGTLSRDDIGAASQINELLSDAPELVLHVSHIIRLCNDLGTSSAELERGDAPTSILCYMRENGGSEAEAREHIRATLNEMWMKINDDVFAAAASPGRRPPKGSC